MFDAENQHGPKWASAIDISRATGRDSEAAGGDLGRSQAYQEDSGQPAE
jgi:hypothetical protein